MSISTTAEDKKQHLKSRNSDQENYQTNTRSVDSWFPCQTRQGLFLYLEDDTRYIDPRLAQTRKIWNRQLDQSTPWNFALRSLCWLDVNFDILFYNFLQNSVNLNGMFCCLGVNLRILQQKSIYRGSLWKYSTPSLTTASFHTTVRSFIGSGNCVIRNVRQTTWRALFGPKDP